MYMGPLIRISSSVPPFVKIEGRLTDRGQGGRLALASRSINTPRSPTSRGEKVRIKERSLNMVTGRRDVKTDGKAHHRRRRKEPRL